MEIPAIQNFNQTVKNALFEHSAQAKKTTVNQRFKVVYITPEQEVERIEAHDLYRGSDQEEMRRTANGKYPAFEYGANNEIVHLSYATIDDNNLFALEFTLALKGETKDEKREKCYIFDKLTINSIIQLFNSSNSIPEFKERMANSYLVWSDEKDGNFDLNKNDIESWKLIKRLEAKAILEKAGIISKGNDRKTKV